MPRLHWFRRTWRHGVATAIGEARGAEVFDEAAHHFPKRLAELENLTEILIRDVSFATRLLCSGHHFCRRAFGDKHDVCKERVGRLLETFLEVRVDGIVALSICP